MDSVENEILETKEKINGATIKELKDQYIDDLKRLERIEKILINLNNKGA